MKQTILVVNNIFKSAGPSYAELAQELNCSFTVIRDIACKVVQPQLPDELDLKIVTCDFTDSLDVLRAITSIEEEIIGITAVGELNASQLASISPALPYINITSESSSRWATDKKTMRERFAIKNPAITPRSMQVSDTTEATLQAVAKTIGFPCMIKPSNLASSLLIQEVNTIEELEERLSTSFEKVAEIYHENNRSDPTLLVEQRLHGDLFSTDVYVNQHGQMTFCPFVYYTSNFDRGLSDFSLYHRIVPVLLSHEQISTGEGVTRQGIEALGLRSTTCHVELMLTHEGWKIIEIGPRVGRFRHRMYKEGFGIDHYKNDVLVRLDQQPVLPEVTPRAVAAFTLYAPKEGTLSHIDGLERLTSSNCLVTFKQRLQTGQLAKHAKHGGHPVLEFVLAHDSPEALQAEISELEAELEIHTVSS